MYSMEKLSKGIQAACGDELKSLLRTLSFNRYVGFLTGIGVCAVTNSLSCVAVLLVSFVSSELMAAAHRERGAPPPVSLLPPSGKMRK